jgi:RNA polymerase sigma factor (sigma-70 family)
VVAVPSIGRATEVTPRRAAPEADATRDLYERYARQIYSYCLHQLGNREEAEDATQSTFLNAFRGFKRGVDPEFESAWLYKIAQNVCLTRQRSSSRRRRVETPGDLEAMQDFVPAHETDPDELIRLPEALDAMPEQQRRALLLREWQGLSYKEIGEELELSQAAVETLLFRARRSLAAGLNEEPVKKTAGIAKRLGGAGDFASIVSIVKSLVLTGGVKVATAVATVAATSVVAATPVTRHALEDVVAPRHDKAPVHQVGSQSKAGSAPVNAPFSLVPAAAAARNAPSATAASSKARLHRLAPRAHPSTGGVAPVVGHAASTTEPSAAISAPSVAAPTVETSPPASAGESSAPAQVDAPAPQRVADEQKESDKPKADSGSKADTTTPAAAAPKKDDSNSGRGTSSGGATPAAAQPTAVDAPTTPAANGNSGAGQGETKVSERSLASKGDDNKDSKNASVQGKTAPVATTPVVTPPMTTTPTANTTTPPAATPPAPPAPTDNAAAPQAQADGGDKGNSRPAEGHRSDGKSENSNGKDGNGKKK